jgi:hypothetical protein
MQDPGDYIHCHETNFKTFTKVWIRRKASLMNTLLGFFWSEFHDGIAMPLKSTICFFYLHLFFGLFTVYQQPIRGSVRFV